ncbi:MAG: alpha/beta hydrolase [bacterium]|nr:alpha/beta hydrolase [bacterium]
MKKVFLIHGWEGYPEEGWRPWLKDELEKQGFEVMIPAMPNSANPKMSEWLSHLQKLAADPDEDCYFVGHSLGCIAILRYLESLEAHQKIGGAVLVAGFTSNLGYDALDTFFQTDIDWTKIKSHCKKFTAIHSSNDPYVPLRYADIFKNRLGAEIIVEQNMKHFSGDDGIHKLPSALESVLALQG